MKWKKDNIATLKYSRWKSTVNAIYSRLHKSFWHVFQLKYPNFLKRKNAFTWETKLHKILRPWIEFIFLSLLANYYSKHAFSEVYKQFADEEGKIYWVHCHNFLHLNILHISLAYFVSQVNWSWFTDASGVFAVQYRKQQNSESYTWMILFESPTSPPSPTVNVSYPSSKSNSSKLIWITCDGNKITELALEVFVMERHSNQWSTLTGGISPYALCYGERVVCISHSLN